MKKKMFRLTAAIFNLIIWLFVLFFAIVALIWVVKMREIDNSKYFHLDEMMKMNKDFWRHDSLFLVDCKKQDSISERINKYIPIINLGKN